MLLNSELPILAGVKEEDWGKIKQVVMEVHDSSRTIIRQISSLLESKGFVLVVEEEKQFTDTGVANVYAIRK